MRAGLQEVTRCPEPPLQSTDGPVCNMSTCWRKNCLKFRPFTKNKQGDAENQNRAAGQLTHRLSIKDLGPRPQMQGCGALQAGRGRAATNPWLPVRTEPGRPEHGQEWGLGPGEQGIAAQLGSCRVTGSTSPSVPSVGSCVLLLISGLSLAHFVQSYSNYFPLFKVQTNLKRLLNS